MNLIIVESPTKAKTISKFLDKNFKVESSFGHIRDLPKSDMGIDIEHGFAPKYIIPTKSKKIVTNLKKLAAKSEKIILASDEDREGEAIAWHLTRALDIPESKTDRIVFHEITKEAILEALKNPRNINIDLVDAQQARRILDRLVGYEMSPFLWKKVARGLSAGRVQSVAVRLIVEREREIKAFKIEEYWTVEVLFQGGKEKLEFKAKLNKINDGTLDKFEIKNETEAKKIISDLEGAKYEVTKIERKEIKKKPLPPFTTSTLQQTANRFLGFSAKQTMMIAQQLYEGVEIENEGSVGLITYMRTDSLNLSEKFIGDAKNWLTKNLGEKYAETKRFKTKAKGAQEAHEAIRPTEASRDPEVIKSSLNGNQYKLYKLIWQRALASQMANAALDNTTVDIDAVNTPYQFRSSGQILKFDGYLKIYPEKSQEIELPSLQEKEELEMKKIEGLEHFTKPPARYSDAGLVKVLEQYGIGRPSTYAPTIATIIERNYVSRDENKRLAPNDIAFIVTDLLIAHFPQIVDYQFTAKMEKNLDEIAIGEIKWQPVIENFYEPFHENLEHKYKEVSKNEIMPEEKSEEVCDKCGKPMIIKTGRYGKFLACSGFPECKNIKSLPGGPEKSKEDEEKMKEFMEKYKGEVCDKCGSPMIVKSGRYGYFLSCSAYPQCKNVRNIQGNVTTGIKCPVCGKGEIVQKRGRRGIFYACSNYPECKNAYWSKPTGEVCPECGSLLVHGKNNKIVCSKKECGYEK